MADERPTYSIIVEMENARSIDWDEIGVGLMALAREIAAVSSIGFATPKVVVSHGGQDVDAQSLRSHFKAEAPELGQVADVSFAACPDGRYYDLKNNGIPATNGNVVVFLDSDTVPEPGWLPTLLEPFQDPETVCVNGYTYLSHDDFFSRTFALIWFFPMAQRHAIRVQTGDQRQQHSLSTRLDLKPSLPAAQWLQGFLHAADASALVRRP